MEKKKPKRLPTIIEPKYYDGKIIIQRVGNTKEKSNKYFREQKELMSRLKSCHDLYDEVQKALDVLFNHNYRHKDAVVFAQTLCGELGLKLDRQAKRFKQSLICWFCENWDVLKGKLEQFKNVNIPKEDKHQAQDFFFSEYSTDKPPLEDTTIFEFN